MQNKTPVYVLLPDNSRHVIGEAEGGGDNTISIRINDALISYMIRKQIASGGITSFSLGMEEDKVDLPITHHPEWWCREHNPVQRRDGKVPWCGLCGLDVNGRIPVSKFGDKQPR